MTHTEEHAILQQMMSLVGQIKLFHWATMCYAKHKALDDLYEVISDKVDLFIESYMGRMKDKQPLKKFNVATSASTDTKKIEKYLEDEREKLLALNNKMPGYPELQNILQEMAAEMSKAIYICRMS